MQPKNDVLILLLREIYTGLQDAGIQPHDVIPADDPLLTAIHQAGIKTTASPTLDELRQALKRALELQGGR